MKATTDSRVVGVLALAIGILVFFAFSRPELHHYDDFSYLYAAANQPLQAITSGEFEPSNVAGFYNAKIGHVILLKGLVNVFGQGLSGIRSIELFYSFLIVLSAVALAATLSVLNRSSLSKSLVIGGLFLTIPVTLYFSSKLLGEGPALIFATCSLLLLALALRQEWGWRKHVCCILSAALLLASVYTRIQLVVFPLGMWAALLVEPPQGISRKNVFLTAAAVGILAAFLFGASVWLTDLNLARGLLTANVVANQHTDLRTRIFKLPTALGPFLLAVPMSLVLLRQRETRFFLAWFVFSSAPVLLAFSYLETRWLLVGAPALAGLVYLCIRYCFQVLDRLGRSTALAGKGILVCAVLLAAVASNLYLQPRTEYGLDEKALARVMKWIDSQYSAPLILVAWTHSDYHYLNFAYPDKAIYTVNTKHFFEPSTIIKDAPTWAKAMSRWYGDRFIGDYATLERYGDRPRLAIAWNSAPGAWDGMQFSWVADDTHVKKTIVHRESSYQVYLLEAVAHP